jgi:L-ribulose-5-phosphate 3-epimerase
MNNLFSRFAMIGLTLVISGFATETPRYQVGVCDWMILKRQKLNAFPLAQEIVADGLELDMGPLGDRPTFDNKLGDPVVRAEFLAKAHELNLRICSIAMSGFYAQSFAERPTVEQMVTDCIDTMKLMGVKIAFLPLGVPGDLIEHPELRPAIVARLKAAGKRAEAAGVVIGVETALDAKGDVALLAEIGSPAIKIFFNFANAWKNQRDVCAELKILGKDRIIQIHASNTDGVWLQNDPQVDLLKIKATLDEMGWSGWLVVERSRDSTHVAAKDVSFNYGANVAYLKKVFQAD